MRHAFGFVDADGHRDVFGDCVAGSDDRLNAAPERFAPVLNGPASIVPPLELDAPEQRDQRFGNAAGKVVDTGSPLANMAVRSVTGKLLGSPDQAAFDAAVEKAS